MLRVFAAIVAASLLIPAGSSAAPPRGDVSITILHTNDLHGHIFPFAYTEAGRRKEELPSVGGASRRATLIRRLRNSIHHPVLLVDSGDTFTRGPLTNAYEGVADAEAMNALGYDLAALGNNEFKAKDGYEEDDARGAQAALIRVVRRSRFHWLCANATDENGSFLEGVQPFAVREIGGIRIGFLGLTAPRSASYPQTEGWTIRDPIEVARKWVPLARKQCDILIAVTHIGVPLDEQLAAAVPGIDAIVGGDSHTFLYKLVEVVNPEGEKVPIVQDGEFGVNLGRFDLRFRRLANGSWKLAAYADKLLPVGADIPEAADVAATLEPYVRPFRTIAGYISAVGATPAERARITNAVIMDAMRFATGADYALNPAGSLFDSFHHHVVTRYDVYAALPFKNHVVIAEISGEDLRKIAAGAPISGNMTQLKAGATYRVALVDHSAHSDYKLKKRDLQNTDRDVRDVVIAYLGAGSKKP